MSELYIEAGRRLALKESDDMEDWYFSWSPRNGNGNAEGTWMEWVDLAQEILKEHSRRVAETIKQP